MTMDRTLKPHGGLIGSRAVLSRAERIAKLIDEGKFDPAADSPLGLPKVRVRHSKAGTKTKKAAEPVLGAEGAVPGAEGAPPAEGAAARGAAPAAKGAAPATKGAAPGAKGPAPAAKAEAKGAAKAQDKKK
jgi:small basic protein (TIGR04137 family)